MKIRLNQENFKSRTPLIVRKRDDTIFFQTQIEVAGDDGYRLGTYFEYAKIKLSKTKYEIGLVALNMLEKFNKLCDLTYDEFFKLKGISMEDYKTSSSIERLQFMEINDFKELESNYEACFVSYELSSKKYTFNISWSYKKGGRIFKEYTKSIGKSDIILFDQQLEFDDTITAEQLGTMLLEAFDRGEKMTDKVLGKTYSVKEIELLDETLIEVTDPKDDHFVDYEDVGVDEVYQAYSYISKKGAVPSAYFIIDTAPQLFYGLSCEGIRQAWIEAFGDGEITVEEKSYGIFKYRAELKNKKYYKIAYLTAGKDGLVLECCMDIENPDKKKKLVTSLPSLFEQFVIRCRKK